MDEYLMQPGGPVRGSIRPPGSKSLTNRALICAALAEGTSELIGALRSEDTEVMVASLQKLGVEIRWDDTEMLVTGCAGRPQGNHEDLFIANSGTSVRFLTALCTLGNGDYRLDGVERMRQRPIADLLEALQQLGADVTADLGNGCPPVTVVGSGLPGGSVSIRGDISSQYLSGLLMATPAAQSNVAISVQGTLVSQPYVVMTLQVMRSFGVEVREDDLQLFEIPAPQMYRATRYDIEPDASAASYFWAAAAITGGRVTVEGLSRFALQGDVAFCDVLAQMGCQVEYGPRSITVTGPPEGQLQAVDVNMNAISDTVQTLAAVALFAEGTTRISDVAHVRHKETDRIGDLARELRKLGASVEEADDGLSITGGNLQGARLETYRDHRMAMSLALVGLRQTEVVILDPGCTDKTYPEFFDDLQKLREGSG